ncbi:family 32 glycoside hydrolase [Melampsora americana]|nr:family 32 glycoside hydrolase [Melampsora americana]
MSFKSNHSPWLCLSVIFAIVVDLSGCRASILHLPAQFNKRDEVHSDSHHGNATDPRSIGCNISRNEPPQISNLLACWNSSLFNVWRPKARMLGSHGWMNDPMGIYQNKDGTWHIGYQCQPNNYLYGNMSQCSALTSDFTYFNDNKGWEDPITLAPSQLYDIRGVLDGTVIQDGWNGYPSLMYTSTYTGSLGWDSQAPEKEGEETLSIAYTQDDGTTWTKLDFGEGGNPVMYHWPARNLASFRDPFLFKSPDFLDYYSNLTLGSSANLTGENFLAISSGIRADLDPINAGPRLFLYRQTTKGNVLDWTYLGVLLTAPYQLTSSSPWRPPYGVNFECGTLASINEGGRVIDKDSNKTQHRLDVFFSGIEGAPRPSHAGHWPIWNVIEYDYGHQDLNLTASIKFSGIIDWGRTYAYVTFPDDKGRQLLIGWCYEDDEKNVLSFQKGYQGAFTLFREVFVKVIRNVSPNSPYLKEKDPSWTIKTEIDGSISVVTLGQRIVSETLTAYKKESTISILGDRTLDLGVAASTNTTPLTNLIPFEKQPSDRYFAITAQLDFHGLTPNLSDPTKIDLQSMVRGGFRILASESEWTDIYYDHLSESLVISREHSSLVKIYGSCTEEGKLRLWPIQDRITNTTSLQSLNLTIIVDNSLVEVYANDQTVITTRVYPWLMNSTSVSFFVQENESMKNSNHLSNSKQLNDPNPNFLPQSVSFSNVELWDGLLNAWPNRPLNSSVPMKTSRDITRSLYSVWDDTL